jgi:hypothetical protein
MNSLPSLGRWDRGLESSSRHEYLYCVRYSVFVLFGVQADCVQDQENKKSVKAQQRAVNAQE